MEFEGSLVQVQQGFLASETFLESCRVISKFSVIWQKFFLHAQIRVDATPSQTQPENRYPHWPWGSSTCSLPKRVQGILFRIQSGKIQLINSQENISNRLPFDQFLSEPRLCHQGRRGCDRPFASLWQSGPLGTQIVSATQQISTWPWVGTERNSSFTALLHCLLSLWLNGTHVLSPKPMYKGSWNLSKL